MAIGPDTLDAEDRLHQALLGITDRQTRDLTEAWVTAWDAAAKELEQALQNIAYANTGDVVSGATLNQSRQIQAALSRMEAALEYAVTRSVGVVTADVQAVMDAAAAYELEMIETQFASAATDTPAAAAAKSSVRASLVRADPAQIGEMVLRSQEQITSLLLPMSELAYTAVKEELVHGMVVGANPRAVARTLVNRVGDVNDLNLSRALTIARTEMLDAARAAAYVTDQVNSSVLAGWLWMAHLDVNTCPSCVGMHGTLHPLEEPGPDDHQNGRCGRVPKVKPWEELGFRGIPEPPGSMVDADRWFAGLGEDDQRRLLGNARYTAWSAGEYPRSAWSTRQENPGWRPSHVPSKPPRQR